MRRAFIVLICSVPALAVGGCGSSGQVSNTIDYAARVYLDPRGWTISVPRGWHMVRFNQRKGEASSAGVLISNVRLPKPSVDPGYPVQVNGNVLPERGVALVIANDTDSNLTHPVAIAPPLPPPESWSKGSAVAGEPYLETGWFSTDGRLFIADAKIGATVSRADLAALKWIAQTLRTL